MARPPRLSRPQIVEAALGLLDEHGADGLTMRALARELGADPMAVYRHVRDKEDLLGAVCDAVIAELDPLDLDAPWRGQLRGMCVQLRGRLAAHPALLPVLAGAPITPAALALTQRALELLDRGGVPPSVGVPGFSAVFSYVLGFAMTEAALPPPPEDRDGLRAAALAHLGEPAEAPPHLDEAMDLLDEAGDFDFGLDLLLEGIEQQAGSRS
jgi:AcrR family transcriptional regulator